VVALTSKEALIFGVSVAPMLSIMRGKKLEALGYTANPISNKAKAIAETVPISTAARLSAFLLMRFVCSEERLGCRSFFILIAIKSMLPLCVAAHKITVRPCTLLM
jgi:hypothetical protein